MMGRSMAEPTLASRLLAGDRRALARAISLVEDDRPEGWELVREIYPRRGRRRSSASPARPGSGKSTLIGALTKARREAGRSVGVLSIDPSSPFTQGALLGDRIRLTEHFLDQGVFIRSMANRGALGGLSEAALQAALLLDAAGRQDVFVETVGRRPGRDRHHRSRRHDRARADAGLGRLDPGPEGGRDGDPGRDRDQQGRPPADRHDGARDPRRALAREPRPLARGGQGAAGGCRSCAPRRRAARASRSSSSASTSIARTSSAAGTLAERRRAQPAQRGARDRDRAAAPQARGGPRTRIPPSASCSSRSWSVASTPPARPAACSRTRRRAPPQPTRVDCPPSTGSSTPVMKRASSEARKSAAFAMSQALPIPPLRGTASSRRRA